MTDAQKLIDLMEGIAKESIEVNQKTDQVLGNAGEIMDILKERVGPEGYAEAMGHVEKYKKLVFGDDHVLADNYLKKVFKDYGG